MKEQDGNEEDKISETQDLPMDLSKSKASSTEPTNIKTTEDTKNFENNVLPEVNIKQEFTNDFFAKYLSVASYGTQQSYVIDIGQTEWLNDKSIKMQTFDPTLNTQVIANALICAENNNVGTLDKIEFPIKAPDVLENPAKLSKSKDEFLIELNYIYHPLVTSLYFCVKM